MCKIILEVEYFIKSMIYRKLKIFQKNSLFQPEMIRRPLFWFKDTKKKKKNTGKSIFNFLKQKKLIFNFFVNRNWKKKLTDSRKRAKFFSDNRKSHHPLETH